MPLRKGLHKQFAFGLHSLSLKIYRVVFSRSRRLAALKAETALLVIAMGDVHRALGRIEGRVDQDGAALQQIGQALGRLECHLARDLDRHMEILSLSEDRKAHLLAVLQASTAAQAAGEIMLSRSEELKRQSEEVGRQVADLSSQATISRLCLDALRIDQRTASSDAAQRAATVDLIASRQLEEISDAAQRAATIDLIASRQLEEISDAAQRAATVDLIALRQLEEISDAAQRTSTMVSTAKKQQSVADVLLSRVDLIASRLAIPLGSELLMQIPDGLALVPVDDGSLVVSVWQTGGKLEPGTLLVMTELLREGDCAIDVGANVGLLTIPMARRVGPTGHVIAVEPSSRIKDILDRTIYINFGSDRVIVHHRAAGAEVGSKTLNIGKTAGHSSLLALDYPVAYEEVRVVPLDDLVPVGTHVRLVKIDVEGFETEVWHGMSRILSENPDLIAITEFGPEHLRRAGISADEWLAPFYAKGFSPFEISELDGSVRSIRSRKALEDIVSVNLLWLRQAPTAYPGLVVK